MCLTAVVRCYSFFSMCIDTNQIAALPKSNQPTPTKNCPKIAKNSISDSFLLKFAIEVALRLYREWTPVADIHIVA